MAKQRKRRRRPPPQNSPSPALWRRFVRMKYAVLVFVATVVTVLEGYPWLSIEEGALLDPPNPYSELFKLSNDGYLPVTDLDADCKFSGTFNGWHVKDNIAKYRDFAGCLLHGGTVTIPCFTMLGGPDISQSPGNVLDIKVTYALYHLNIKALRRSQTFHFKALTGTDNAQHWQFLAESHNPP